jgi:hypothetical protein
MGAGGDVGSRGGGSGTKKTKLKCRGHCAARGVREVSMLVLNFYKRRLPRYICRLTDECMRLCSSIENILLGSNTEEYITVIFLRTEEDKNTKECTPFS